MDWPDLFISLLVLVAVSLASDYGSPALAAVAATAPTGVPLSLWLVKTAAAHAKPPLPEAAQLAQLDEFLQACIKGMLAACCFSLGALWLVRSARASSGDHDGVPSLGALLLVGYCCWGVTLLLFRHLPV